MFCQSVMYFHTPANSLKFTPPLFSLSNMAEKDGEEVKDITLRLILSHIYTHNSNMLSSRKGKTPHIVLKSCQRPEKSKLWVSHLNNRERKLLDPPHQFSTPHPHVVQSNYLPTKGVLSQDMLLAGGLLNNGFTEYDTVGRGGDGIIGIYSASYTTKNEQSTHETWGKIFLTYFCLNWKQQCKICREFEAKKINQLNSFRFNHNIKNTDVC